MVQPVETVAMIARILTGVCLTLLMTLAGVGWSLKQSMDTTASLRAGKVQLEIANEQTAENLVAMGRDIIARDELVAQVRKQQRRMEAANRAADQKLEQLKNENEDLREYLADLMHGDVVYWLWGADDGIQDGNNQGSATVLAAGADTGAAQPVTHQQGWTWCRDVRDALRSCNDDKAAVCDWLGDQSAQ